MRSIAVLLLLICCFNVKAQKQGNEMFVLVSPAILSFYQPVVQAGVGKDLNKRFSLMGEFTFAHPTDHRQGFKEINIYRISGELKWFPTPEKRKFYISVQTAYSHRDFQKDSGAYYTNDNMMVRYAHSDIHSPLLSYAVKFGNEASLGRHFFLDMFLGFGGRISFTNYQTNEFHKTPNEEYPHCQISIITADDYLFNYRKHLFHMPMGFRLGYRF